MERGLAAPLTQACCPFLCLRHVLQILAVIAFNLIAALLPAKGKFVADEVELQERPAGPLQDPTISILQPRKFFGISGFGFSKANVRQCNSLCPFMLTTGLLP